MTSIAAVHESASLIGRLGSSAFRLSITTVATSLAGSCLSTESAHGPFHHGIRERGGTIFRAALPSTGDLMLRRAMVGDASEPRAFEHQRVDGDNQRASRHGKRGNLRTNQDGIQNAAALGG